MTDNDSGPDPIPPSPRSRQNGHMPPALSVRALANSRETGLDHSVVKDFLDVAEEWARTSSPGTATPGAAASVPRRRHREIEVFLAACLSALAGVWRR